MSSSRNQNSILVLATLGVYLGLVLVGATPQALAQAAMTRSFDVKDEVEFKDDLDTKPDNFNADPAETTTSEIGHKITSSVESFLSKFKTVDSVSPLCATFEPTFESENLREGIKTAVHPDSFNSHVPINELVVITNLPRAGLDPLLANDAK